MYLVKTCLKLIRLTIIKYKQINRNSAHGRGIILVKFINVTKIPQNFSMFV